MSVRKAKLESLLQSIMAPFLNERRAAWGIDELITIDQVFLAPDLKSAQVWVSFTPHNQEVAERNFDRLTRHLADIQKAIFKKLAIKRVPRLALKLSDPERSFRLQEIFDTLEGHGPTGSNDIGDPEGGGSDTLGNA